MFTALTVGVVAVFLFLFFFFDIVIEREVGGKKHRERKRGSINSTSQTLNGCCCSEGCFMEQKQPDLCVVFSLIDCPGLRLLGVRRVLSEYLLECWEDKNHSLSHHTTEAEWRIQTKKREAKEAHTDGQTGTQRKRRRRAERHREAES